MEIEAFLTAYDPSDLPGTSIDPLGFERGYLLLAEKILPGLTNVASRPRYFGMLAAGAYLAGDLFHEPQRKQYETRIDKTTRLERFWALGNVLASTNSVARELELYGLRGVNYAKAKAEELARRGKKETNADFKLLSRQVQYGGIGMYGTVADRMRILDRQTLCLSADLGRVLGEGFIKETELPKAIIKAIEEDGSVDLAKLASWGDRAFIGATVGPTEANCLYDALHLEPVRSRMVGILSKYPPKEGETELHRLSRIRENINGQNKSADLKEAINAILSYESSYRWILLAFERILWLCRSDPSGSISPDDLSRDQVMEKAVQSLPKRITAFMNAVEKGQTEEFKRDLNRIDDVRQFLQELAAICTNGGDIAKRIMLRHSEVQRGKFDKGRRKMPWLEYVSKGRIALTSTRVGGLTFQVTDVSRIPAHPYRLNSADALILASRQR